MLNNTKFNYSQTFISDRNFVPLYHYTSNYLDKLGFKFESKLGNNLDLIFHLNYNEKNKYDNIDLKILNIFNSNKDSSPILETNLILKYLSNETGRNYIYDIFNRFEIPNIHLGNLEKYENLMDLDLFPFVLKDRGSSKGNGIYLIENEKDYFKLKNFYNINLNQEFESKFIISKFIETNSNHYNHYRIFTIGSGEILGSTLNYSRDLKNNSKNFLGFNDIVSNVSKGGISISLNPNNYSKKNTSLDEKILIELNIQNQELPNFLKEYSSFTAKLFAEYGIYIMGQDWIQEKGTNNFYCLEINYLPETNIFNTLFNKGNGDKKFGLEKAGELIANGIYTHLENK